MYKFCAKKALLLIALVLPFMSPISSYANEPAYVADANSGQSSSQQSNQQNNNAAYPYGPYYMPPNYNAFPDQRAQDSIYEQNQHR